MIYIGIYLAIGVILAGWSYVDTLPHERWSIPYLTLIFLWGFLLFMRVYEYLFLKED
jgi:hypothetical protein